MEVVHFYVLLWHFLDMRLDFKFSEKIGKRKVFVILQIFFVTGLTLNECFEL